MAVLADTSFVYAVISSHDRDHERCRTYYLAEIEPILLPAITLPEITFLAERRGGTPAVVKALETLDASRIQITDLTGEDYRRASGILKHYSDSRIDFVDAAIMALAERLQIKRILTLDRRDFSIFRPVHIEAFELYP